MINIPVIVINIVIVLTLFSVVVVVVVLLNSLFSTECWWSCSMADLLDETLQDVVGRVVVSILDLSASTRHRRWWSRSLSWR